MKLPNFENPPADSSIKIGYDFSNKDVQKWKLSENTFSNKCDPKLGFFMESQILTLFDYQSVNEFKRYNFFI